MSAALTAFLAIIAQLAPSLGVPSVVVQIITALETLLPVLIKEVQDVAPLVQNIIDGLRSNTTGAVSADQLAQLDALEAKYDAEFEAAVAQPDSSGMPQ